MHNLEVSEGEEGAQQSISATSRNVLKKPVDTLAMTPAEGGRINVIERKLYFTLMWFAQRQGWQIGQESFQAPLAEVLRKMSYNSRNMKLIRDALTSMTTTAIAWQSPTAGEGSNWGVSGMISYAEIMSNRSGSKLEWSYSPKVRPEILNPFPFARGSLEVQDLLKTHAGLALYDIVTRYLSSATGLTPRRHWTWWRPVLTGNWNSINSQLEFKAFNRDYVKKAINEINSKTTVEVELITHKAGAKVVDLQFMASRKKNYKPPLQSVNTESGLKEIGRAISLGIAQKQAELFFEEHGESTFSKGLDILEGRIAKPSKHPIEKPKNYLEKVLENHASDAQTEALINNQNGQALEKQKRIELLAQFRANRFESAWALYQESNENDKRFLDERFVFEVLDKGPPSIKRLYEQKGFRAASVKSLMKTFLAENYFGERWKSPSDDELLRFALSFMKTD
jgi:Initiator Replication protein